VSPATNVPIDSPNQERIAATARQLAAVRLSAVVLLGLAIVAGGLGAILGWPANRMLTIFLILGAGLVVASIALALVRCPRCNRSFIRFWERGDHIWLAKSCQHCGLRL
jgi:hypothetical protein